MSSNHKIAEKIQTLKLTTILVPGFPTCVGREI